VQLQQDEANREDRNEEYSAPEEDDEPDWNAIAKNHPASTDVPIFLEARERRRKLDEQFTEALNGWNTKMHAEIDSVWDALVGIYQTRSENINEVEEMIKNLFLSNEITREEMEKKLEACAREVQSLYSSLMRQICQPLTAPVSTTISESKES
jgi:hypothetical protein